MNATDIWPGSEYAVAKYGKKRGQGFDHNWLRIRAVRVFKQQEFGKSNATAYVEGLLLDRDGNPISNDLKTVRVYDVMDHWDDYEDALQHYEVKQEQQRKEREEADRVWREQYEQRQRERAEREQQEREAREARLAKERQINIDIHTALRSKGINLTAISIDRNLVCIEKEEMLRWLGLKVTV